MRGFLFRRTPRLDRMLLVESGSRSIFETFIPTIYASYGHGVRLDLVTCYAGAPEGYRPESGRIYRVTDYPDGASRKRLFAELASNGYTAVAIICAAQPIMTKWKWLIAAKVPAKLLIINENGDYFWVDRTQWRTICEFFAFRSGLSGGQAVPALTRLVLLPFTLTYLLLYAGVVHLRRKVHS